MNQEILLFPADDTAPKIGLYSVILRKGCLPRALGVTKRKDGMTAIYIDGALVTYPALDWKDAFGFIYNQAFTKVTKLTAAKYRELIAQRTADKVNGMDLNRPIDHNKTEIKI